MAREGYTPKQLARISGVSVRTLHHYDQIGLLVPQRRDNGYRSYCAADVERLQQILLYRQMGLDLHAVGELLDARDYDPARALQQHLDALRSEHARLETLIATVEKTLATMKGDATMTDQERFEGLKAEAIAQNEKTYGAEARARYGDKAVDEANRKLARMSEQEWTDIMELEEAIKAQLKAAMATGDPASAEAAELVRMHARWLAAHWPDGAYSPEAHRGMAKGYLADQRFIDYYDSACGAGATQFLHDAIYANA